MAVVLEWVETGQVFPLPLGRPAVIGRGHHAEISLDDLTVSRQHCQAQWDGCRVWVHDLNSTNGTYLNGERFRGGTPLRGPEGALLRLGDVLHLGDVRLRLATPSRVEAMARHAEGPGDYGDLPVLADALEEAGCTGADLLAHCRSGGGHLPGCWAVDLILGRG